MADQGGMQQAAGELHLEHLERLGPGMQEKEQVLLHHPGEETGRGAVEPGKLLLELALLLLAEQQDASQVAQRMLLLCGLEGT